MNDRLEVFQQIRDIMRTNGRVSGVAQLALALRAVGLARRVQFTRVGGESACGETGNTAK